jgi:hypothetical protein
MLLASYGGGGSSSAGGAISYGPVFWIVVVIVAIALVSLVAWFISRRRAGARTAGRVSSPRSEPSGGTA